MGKKKACFAVEGFVCQSRDCPYMVECCAALEARKVSKKIAKDRAAVLYAKGDARRALDARRDTP